VASPDFPDYVAHPHDFWFMWLTHTILIYVLTHTIWFSGSPTRFLIYVVSIWFSDSCGFTQ
jgi:hypothetical protein